MAYTVPPGVLPAMPKLRWAQVMTAASERVARASRPAARPHAHLRARHPRGVDAGEHHRALFFVAKPYARGAENQKKGQWVRAVAQPLTGKTLGILARRDRPARGAYRRLLGMRVIAPKRRPAPWRMSPLSCRPSAQRKCWRSPTLLLLLPATPETDNFINASASHDEAERMAPQLRSRPCHQGRRPDCSGRREKIAGAVLDVYRQEPLPAQHPFWTTRESSCCRISAAASAARRFVARLFVENLAAS